MFATAQPLIPLVVVWWLVAECERHLRVLDHRALDWPTGLSRLFEQGA